ncbi:hypothetical protein B0T16DRAFT_329143 [Cercophora newfieldiana]|uniref:E3 ubiquitin-protein ligase CCNB1IP1 n=1 Tax=Cercophora newfieldiana TaxID=92897 RepID=A0AA39Y665_9PEZI|nr:hypothetical protein B0T16DRAFT_329143 [Cercophora newfieldiana]
MEQNLNCNVKKCSTELAEQAVYGFAGPGPYTCPVCRQPLADTELLRQNLRPSEEWKSVALAGLSPTVVMECAGRALTFWSYQMTNQILFHLQRNQELEENCTSLEAAVNDVWNQGNARISTLGSKVKELEQREQALVRKCEDLRHSLSEKTKELSRSQELYSKLKQRVLLDRSPGSAAGQNHKPRPGPVQNILDSSLHTGAYGRQPQFSGPHAPLGGGNAVPDYFPTSPNYTKAQAGPSAHVGWARPVASQGNMSPSRGKFVPFS